MEEKENGGVGKKECMLKSEPFTKQTLDTPSSEKRVINRRGAKQICTDPRC